MPSAYGHLNETAKGQALLKRWINWGGGASESIDGVETQVLLRFPFKNRTDHEHLMDGIRKAWPTN